MTGNKENRFMLQKEKTQLLQLSRGKKKRREKTEGEGREEKRRRGEQSEGEELTDFNKKLEILIILQFDLEQLLASFCFSLPTIEFIIDEFRTSFQFEYVLAFINKYVLSFFSLSFDYNYHSLNIFYEKGIVNF